MIGEIFLCLVVLVGILLMWKYRKLVEKRDQHALEKEVELDFEEELLDNEDSDQAQLLQWLEDEQVADTIIQMKSKNNNIMKALISFKLLTYSSLFIGYFCFAGKGDWSNWRGPNYNGSTSDSFSYPENFSINEGVKWSFDLPGLLHPRLWSMMI